ncbi:MAG: hypothetical protein RI894_1999 [Bacteroidota bacterium]|jgi:hypothetical protein
MNFFELYKEFREIKGAYAKVYKFLTKINHKVRQKIPFWAIFLKKNVK